MAKLKPNQFILDGHTFTEIPLLFQTEMVQAVLEDRKTQTRRTKGLDYLNNPNYFKEFDSMEHVVSLDGKERYGIMLNLKRDPGMGVFVKYPYGKPGDLLWVRETWASTAQLNIHPSDENYGIVYKADGQPWTDYEGWKWKPSLFMPKDGCRIWLMVEEIRVERLQDITEEDAVAEGVEKKGVVDPEFDVPVVGWKDYDEAGNWFTTGDGFWGSPEKRSFRSLWFSINGLESWKQNPWVWVIKFRVLSKTGRPSDEVILKNYKQITHA